MSWLQRIFVGDPNYLNCALKADLASRAVASGSFGCMVADARSRPVCGQWDYKKEIGDEWGNFQIVDFSLLGIAEEQVFFYDIWANFHFGYLGMVGGFSEEALLTGAAVEHAASNLQIEIQDDPSDLVANQVGIRLYKTQSLSEGTLLWWIYIEKDRLNKGRQNENGEWEIYR